MIDNALYDAFGQRQVSTMYKGINQYHVVMEVDPDFQHHPGRDEESLRPLHRRKTIPLSAFTHYEPVATVAGRRPSGPIPGCHLFF